MLQLLQVLLVAGQQALALEAVIESVHIPYHFLQNLDTFGRLLSVLYLSNGRDVLRGQVVDLGAALALVDAARTVLELPQQVGADDDASRHNLQTEAVTHADLHCYVEVRLSEPRPDIEETAFSR